MTDSKDMIGKQQLVQIEETWGVGMRDLACDLLGGDPFQAQAVVQQILGSLLGQRPAERASWEKLPAWLADEVVHQCLLITGNGSVTGKRDYMVRHRSRKEVEADRPQAPRAEASPPPTRKARATLRLVRSAPRPPETAARAEPVKPQRP